MKKVIVAPLSWGLGHASRCVPIIKSLIENKFTPVIASDGHVLSFLQKEFPDLESFELPLYQISYGKNLKLSLLLKSFSLWRVAKKERKVLNQYLFENDDVVGVISDNRFGIYTDVVPCVYMTHQINVLLGWLTPVTSFFHQRIISKYDECWIPDEEGSLFSGKLSTTTKNLHQKYVGILSRFKKKSLKKTIDILIILSGPEPNRLWLEEKMKAVFKESKQRVWMIRGVIEEEKEETCFGNLTLVNFMLSNELEEAISSSEMVICRSGYSSVMDLIRLDKKALLIPTKSQSEQEYLAKFLQRQGYFPYVEEINFDLKALDEVANYSYVFKKTNNTKNLFRLFEGE